VGAARRAVENGVGGKGSGKEEPPPGTPPASAQAIPATSPEQLQRLESHRYVTVCRGVPQPRCVCVYVCGCVCVCVCVCV
jgi:hypothetical protein